MPALRRRSRSITPRSGRRRLLAVGLAGAAALAAGPVTGAPAATKAPSAKTTTRALAKSADLWAAVNICDTAAHPDTIGIRGSMPGSGKAEERMYMRFQLQYYDQAKRVWRSIGATGDSGFVPLGSARKRRARESGRNFTVRPPRTGAFYLRGSVTFEYRQGKKVVRRFRERTHSKHPGTAGADPKGYSASRCELRP